ncbi:hypothetical protein, partial [Clostridium tarantellae]|uniref:hypothetical protein n=1 Tax=Clostridium tarantellae TaxID=39493 RepID=UPI0014781DD3
DEIPNNFEILSSTINDEKSNPIVTNNKVQWKVDEIPSKGINIKYTIKPKEGFTPKENVFENINGKLVCEEVTYGENKQVNKKIVKFENCLVNNSEKVPKKVIQNENNNKVEVQKEETNLMVQQPKESKQLGIVTLQNQVESSNPYIYTYYMFSYEIKGKTDICKNFGGVFKDGNSVYTTKLPLGEYSLILSKPIKYDFVEIELNGKKVSAQQLKDGRLNINLTEANPTINIKVKTKEYNKPYFSNSDYIGTNVFPDPNS